MSPLLSVFGTLISGTMAGALGAVLGLGGGIFLVPFLVSIVGLPFGQARAVSLLTVIATSTAVAGLSSGRAFVNVRLGLLLQIAASLGALGGGLTAKHLSERALVVLFLVVVVGVAVVMLARLDKRNVLDASVDPGTFGGRFFDSEHARDVSYRLRRAPFALAVAFVAGNVSSLLGVGGGVLLIPALNLVCGIPIRAAAATSAFMIGITAVSAAPIFYAHGDMDPHLAAAAVLGVLAGSTWGMRRTVSTRPRHLKLMMAIVLLLVAAVMAAKLR